MPISIVPAYMNLLRIYEEDEKRREQDKAKQASSKGHRAAKGQGESETNLSRLSSSEYQEIGEPLKSFVPTETIKIKYWPDSPHLEQVEESNWVDTYVYETTTLKKGEMKYIPLGFACELPYGYEAYLEPRSSTFKRWHVLMANEIGIIDSSYCSNTDQWMFPALAVEDTVIPKGKRICQFRIQKRQPNLIFQEVASLENEARGGLGSTGE